MGIIDVVVGDNAVSIHQHLVAMLRHDATGVIVQQRRFCEFPTIRYHNHENLPPIHELRIL